MTLWVIVAGLLLTGVAAAGVLHPLRRPRELALEGPPDPLDEERRTLISALRDLDEDRAAGDLEEGEYRALRVETERRAVSVMRELEARDRLPADLGEVRPPERPDRAGGRRTGLLPGLVAAGLTVALLAVALPGAVRDRGAGEEITGAEVGGDPLSFFEERVREHPDDLAARLDLADRYLAEGEVSGAIEQYTEALRIDPGNAEAHARLGFLLFRAGRPQEGLAEVDRALETDPRYPEALYFRGAILFSLQRPAEAEAALRDYLEAAPFGAYREDARDLLSDLRRSG